METSTQNKPSWEDMAKAATSSMQRKIDFAKKLKRMAETSSQMKERIFKRKRAQAMKKLEEHSNTSDVLDYICCLELKITELEAANVDLECDMYDLRLQAERYED